MMYKQFIAITCGSLLFAACQKDLQSNAVSSEDAAKKGGIAGAVYTLSNESDNKVLSYTRTAGGELSFAAAYSTGGMGSGAGLGSQGALTLSNNNQWLLAVNAGSNTVSSFKADGSSLHLVSEVSSGGNMPISVTIDHDLVYVLNAGGTANISGFRIDDDGMLHPIMNSTRPLSAPSPGPAQVSFVNDGATLVVTEKGTNKIISYTVNGMGVPQNMHMITSANPTPFGFAVGKKGLIYVSEADGGNPNTSTVSSYKVENDGTISLVDGPNTAHQTAACWVVVTNNGKYVYATNTGSNTVSAFAADAHGNMDVLYDDVPSGTGMSPIDAALSNNSQFMYVLNAGSHSMVAFSIGNKGYPEYLQTISGLPASTVGLASK